MPHCSACVYLRNYCFRPDELCIFLAEREHVFLPELEKRLISVITAPAQHQRLIREDAAPHWRDEQSGGERRRRGHLDANYVNCKPHEDHTVSIFSLIFSLLILQQMTGRNLLILQLLMLLLLML